MAVTKAHSSSGLVHIFHKTPFCHMCVATRLVAIHTHMAKWCLVEIWYSSHWWSTDATQTKSKVI